MCLTTETAIGHILFSTPEEANAFIAEMAEFADPMESFEVRAHQGNRFHVARFYGGKFEAYC